MVAVNSDEPPDAHGRCGWCGHPIGKVPSFQNFQRGARFYNDCDRGRDQEIARLAAEVGQLQRLMSLLVKDVSDDI